MIKIDKEKCIGCGLCPAICEAVFEMGKNNKAQVKKGAKKDAPCIKDAIESCPTEAIS